MCHSSALSEEDRQEAPLGANFDTYEGVVLYADRIFVRAVLDEDMPPVGAPDPQDLSLLAEWVVCGLPE
jgi:uncharacterized membrane protein